MVSLEQQQKIDELMQRDNWQFMSEDTGVHWLRTASNRELVGMSHRTFATKEEAIENARIVGYENNFAAANSVCWEEYQDANGDYRWRLLDTAGTVLNRSHEGYKTKAASQKNAVRHGYGRAAQVACTCGCPQDCKKPVSAVLPYWVIGLSVLAFILLPFFASENTSVPLSPAVNRLQLFADVPPGLAQADCIHSLAVRGVFEGSATKSGSNKPVFGLQNYVRNYELAKIMAEVSNVQVATCSTSTSGQNWYEPYVQCAKQNNWRVFMSNSTDITANATKAAVATTVLDAYNLSVDEAQKKGVLTALGTFEPNELVTRAELASLLCTL